MDRHFFTTPQGILALAVFIVGAAFYAAPSMKDTLAEVSWPYFVESMGENSSELYQATFMQAAAAYLAVADDVADIQAQAYVTSGKGIAAALGLLGETPPVAAVASWYVDAENRVEQRLTPQ